MGLERMTAILQGVQSVYDIDLFKALIAASEAATGVPAKGEHQASHRVIADHLRATSFLIAEGVLPSNVGRGYVLRRIMRRAMRHAHLLGAKEPLMYRLVPALVHEMGETYPELVRGQALITETIKLEETRFRNTLDKGVALLDKASAGLKKGDVFSGDTAFRLYDTYGFPLDLTQDALKPRGIAVDTDAFETAMQQQKGGGAPGLDGHRARRPRRASGSRSGRRSAPRISWATRPRPRRARCAPSSRAARRCRASRPATRPRWYSTRRRSTASPADRSATRAPSRAPRARCSRVTDTQKRLGDLIVHFGRVENGSFKPGDAVALTVDHVRRTATRANHSATHLLHEALRQVLGTHVAQKGSLVAPDRLRFDFSHTQADGAGRSRGRRGHGQRLRAAELARGDPPDGPGGCHRVGRDGAVRREVRRRGAGRLHGREGVRPCGSDTEWQSLTRPGRWSCAAARTSARTGDIGLVKIVAESASAAGVRRIEALTAEGAREYLAQQDQRMRELAGMLRTKPDEVVDRVKALLEERRQIERQLGDAKRQLALGGSAAQRNGKDADGASAPIRAVGGIKLLARTVQGLAPKDLRGLIDDGKKQLGSGVVAIVGVTEDGKAALAVGVTDDLTKRINAVDLAKAGAEALGGKGGGRPDLAQAGGPDGSKADAALKAIEARLAG